MRTIASVAGVSPGLVDHHFGSIAGLRAACDAQVLGVLAAAKSEFITKSGLGELLCQLVEVEDHAPLLAYIVRSFEDGGEVARAVFEQAVACAERFLADGDI